jgi:hypothetical protein
MGDLIDFMAYKRKREALPNYNAELDRLWVVIVIWTPYRIARERQVNSNWMDMFFYPDEDW